MTSKIISNWGLHLNESQLGYPVHEENVKTREIMYLFIRVGSLRLSSRASLGRAVGPVLLALALLILRILCGATLARPWREAVQSDKGCVYVCVCSYVSDWVNAHLCELS